MKQTYTIVERNKKLNITENNVKTNIKMLNLVTLLDF